MTWTAGFVFQETAVWGTWFQIRPNRAFKPLQTPEAVFDSGLFWTAVISPVLRSKVFLFKVDRVVLPTRYLLQIYSGMTGKETCDYVFVL